jgi:hypothetical protein
MLLVGRPLKSLVVSEPQEELHICGYACKKPAKARVELVILRDRHIIETWLATCLLHVGI